MDWYKEYLRRVELATNTEGYKALYDEMSPQAQSVSRIRTEIEILNSMYSETHNPEILEEMKNRRDTLLEAEERLSEVNGKTM